MQTFVKKYKVKKDFLEVIREWSRTLNSRKDEVLKTLEQEGVFIETAFLDKQGDDFYLIYFIKCTNLDNALKVFAASDAAIDSYHRKVMSDSLCQSESLELLIDFCRY